ncbi:hypothetical protein [Vibrio penaeicida]|uniref:hypothetical protein n=1 Tax=Vibrio penaeicida TaxID=104609 RepID=UPI001CC64DE2|nr:hypothetical protein [Vibrio penaeicida]
MDIQNKKLQTFLLLLVINFSYITFANDLSNLGLILKSFDTFAFILSTCIGILLLISGIKRLKEHGDNPNSHSKPLGAFATIAVGALCFNLTATLDTVATSVFGENSGYCSAYADLKTSSCFDTSTSEVMKPVEELMNDKGFSAEDQKILIDSVDIAFLMFKVVGILYFIKGLYNLHAEGHKPKDQQNYGRIILGLIAAIMMANGQDTILVIKETLNYVGFDFS